MAPVSKGRGKERALRAALAGPQRLWRTVGPVIPCRVASQQSPTPFHQAMDKLIQEGPVHQLGPVANTGVLLKQ